MLFSKSCFQWQSQFAKFCRSKKNEKFTARILFNLKSWNFGLRNKSVWLIFLVNFKSIGWIEPNMSLNTLILINIQFNDKLQNSHFWQYLTKYFLHYLQIQYLIVFWLSNTYENQFVFKLVFEFVFKLWI